MVNPDHIDIDQSAIVHVLPVVSVEILSYLNFHPYRNVKVLEKIVSNEVREV